MTRLLLRPPVAPVARPCEACQTAGRGAGRIGNTFYTADEVHNIAAAKDGERSYTARNRGEVATRSPVAAFDGPWTAERMREIARGVAA